MRADFDFRSCFKMFGISSRALRLDPPICFGRVWTIFGLHFGSLAVYRRLVPEFLDFLFPKCYSSAGCGAFSNWSKLTHKVPWPATSWTLCCPTSLGGREPMHINRLKQVKILAELGWIKLNLFTKPLSWEDHHDFEACDVVRHESCELQHDYHRD